MLTRLYPVRKLRAFRHCVRVCCGVLSTEIELANLDARHWSNWWRLLVPPRVRERPPWALIVVERSPLRIVKAIVTGRGSIAAPLRALDAAAIAACTKALGVAATVVIERELVGELSEEIESALRMDQDFVAQGLIALRALRRRAGDGVWTDPPLLELLPAPAYEPLQRTFDLLVPDRTALAAYVIEDDRSRVHASVIAVKEGGDIVRAGTHRAIADLVPEAAFARGWERGYQRVLGAIEERFGKPSIALFLERATLMRVMTGPSDQLAREVTAKRLVIDPAPAWLLGLLGSAAVAAVAGRAASALAQLLPQSARDRASAIAARARDAMIESGAHPFALLGFDPIELWSRLRHFYRDPGRDPTRP